VTFDEKLEFVVTVGIPQRSVRIHLSNETAE